MIFDAVLHDHNPKLHLHARANYASVCREWQPYFERRTFSQLVLRPSCLPEFQQLTAGKNKRRLDYLGRLWFLVEIKDYDCTDCQSPEDETTVASNEAIFTHALWRLLKILSCWTMKGWTALNPTLKFRLGDMLTLFLGVYSPSDSQHVFRDLRLSGSYPLHFYSDLNGYIQ